MIIKITAITVLCLAFFVLGRWTNEQDWSEAAAISAARPMRSINRVCEPAITISRLSIEIEALSSTGFGPDMGDILEWVKADFVK